jgi:hypothetical protein
MASYSPQTISHLVNYANSRGVRIVPEFDTPGHTAAIGQAYPDLIADCYDWLTAHYDSELRWSMWDSVALDVTKQETKDFVEDVMNEMSSLFPDQYFHVSLAVPFLPQHLFNIVLTDGRLVAMRSIKVAGLLFLPSKPTCKRMAMPHTTQPLKLGSMTTPRSKGNRTHCTPPPISSFHSHSLHFYPFPPPQIMDCLCSGLSSHNPLPPSLPTDGSFYLSPRKSLNLFPRLRSFGKNLLLLVSL